MAKHKIIKRDGAELPPAPAPQTEEEAPHSQVEEEIQRHEIDLTTQEEAEKIRRIKNIVSMRAAIDLWDGEYLEEVVQLYLKIKEA